MNREATAVEIVHSWAKDLRNFALNGKRPRMFDFGGNSRELHQHEMTALRVEFTADGRDHELELTAVLVNGVSMIRAKRSDTPSRHKPADPAP